MSELPSFTKFPDFEVVCNEDPKGLLNEYVDLINKTKTAIQRTEEMEFAQYLKMAELVAGGSTPVKEHIAAENSTVTGILQYKENLQSLLRRLEKIKTDKFDRFFMLGEARNYRLRQSYRVTPDGRIHLFKSKYDMMEASLLDEKRFDKIDQTNITGLPRTANFMRFHYLKPMSDKGWIFHDKDLVLIELSDNSWLVYGNLDLH